MVHKRINRFRRGKLNAGLLEPGQFATLVHDLTMDSKEIYIGEAATAGRVQKFTPKE